MEDNTGALLLAGGALLLFGLNPGLLRGITPINRGGVQVQGLVQGGIQTVSIGAGTLQKQIGDTLTVNVAWTAGTTKNGQPIPWNYYIAVTINGPQGVAEGPDKFNRPSVSGAQQEPSLLSTTLDSVRFAPSTSYRVDVQLYGADVDATGAMLGTYSPLGTVVSSYFQTAAASVAQTTGSIGSVTLSQGRSRMIGQRFLRLGQGYDSSIGGVLNPHIPGITLAPAMGQPSPLTQSIPGLAISWQAQSAAVTRAFDTPGGKVASQQRGPFAVYGRAGMGYGPDRPVFGGVVMNSGGGGGATLNGPGQRYAWGQALRAPFFQPVYPRGSTSQV